MTTTRRIFFNRLAIDARIGVLEHELRATQPIYIDVEADIKILSLVDDNNIKTVLDYRQLRDAIIEECTRKHIHLIETLAEQIAQRLMDDFDELLSIKLRIRKPMAFSDCEAVGIELTTSRAE